MMMGVPCSCGSEQLLTKDTEREVRGVIHRGYAPCFLAVDLKLVTPEQQILKLREEIATLKVQLEGVQLEVIRLNRVLGQQPV
jgi:hypothetical protein